MLGKDVFRCLVVGAACFIAVSGNNITYEEYAKFPKLFHLDDYHECLGQEDGLYCVGTFHVKALQEPDPTYELMKEYSRYGHHFNRTLIHRGYCVSSRCPSLSHIRNVSERFDRCVAQDLKRRSLNTTLTEQRYCRSHAHIAVNKNSASVETPHRVFLYIVLGLLALNVIGTIYDVMKGDDAKKSKILTSWSIVSNWPHLVGPYPDGDPRLAALLPVESFRVIMLVMVILTHAVLIEDGLYLANPKHTEQASLQWTAMHLKNGTSMVQLFLMLSSFMLAHSLLDFNQINIGTLLKQIGKRIFRIMPVYLLVIGFAATWWPLMNDGPLWHSTVDIESQVCRRKFWSHVFFFNNFFEPTRHCLIQTWFLAVDMQLYIFGCIVILCLDRVRRLALRLLAIGFVFCITLSAVLAYIYHWRPMMFVSGPENLRTMYLNEPSFHEFYTNPMGSLSTMMVGFFIAYLHHHLNKTGFKPDDHKWLIYSCQMMLPLLFLWPSCGNLLRDFTSREFSAFYIAFERLVTLLMVGVLFFGVYNGITKRQMKTEYGRIYNQNTNGHDPHMPNTSTKGFLNDMFSSRIWYPLGRSSLSVLMLHWCVNMMFKAPTLQPITKKGLDLVSDTITTTFVTYLLALPVTLLIDIPFNRLYSAITSRQKQE